MRKRQQANFTQIRRGKMAQNSPSFHSPWIMIGPGWTLVAKTLCYAAEMGHNCLHHKILHAHPVFFFTHPVPLILPKTLDTIDHMVYTVITPHRHASPLCPIAMTPQTIMPHHHNAPSPLCPIAFMPHRRYALSPLRPTIRFLCTKYREI